MGKESLKIIISGASKGIGKAITYKFAAAGFSAAICARSEGPLKALQEDLQKQYPEQEFIAKTADVSDKAQLAAFGQFVLDQWGTADILMNNAGFFLPGQIHSEEDGALEQQIETNLYSAYRLSRQILPSMIERKKGHVFNICSTASVVAYPNGGSYCISKHAMLGFSKVLREEMKEHNIRVTSILPGATFTASWEGVELPQERFMSPEDVADIIFESWKLSDRTVIEEILLRPQLGDLG